MSLIVLSKPSSKNIELKHERSKNENKHLRNKLYNTRIRILTTLSSLSNIYTLYSTELDNEEKLSSGFLVSYTRFTEETAFEAMIHKIFNLHNSAELSDREKCIKLTETGKNDQFAKKVKNTSSLDLSSEE